MKKLNVLFLCTGNSCRSQMAEAWAQHIKSDQVNAYSAGIETHGLNPSAVKVMAEVGIDISQNKSKHVDELKEVKFDYVVTVCGHANESCPVFASEAQIVHVAFEDPPQVAKILVEQGASEEAQLDCYRKVRDEIKAFVETLPASLTKTNEKGFFSKLFEKLDKKLEAKAKASSCCGGENETKGGSSCC